MRELLKRVCFFRLLLDNAGKIMYYEYAKVNSKREVRKMRITDKEFYTEKLDLSISEMKLAHDLYLSGRDGDAASAFASYFKNSLNADIIFNLV